MSKLIYRRHWFNENSRVWHEDEIPYLKALDIVHGTYRDCDQINDMLLLPNRIPCKFSTVEVCFVDEDGVITHVSEHENFIPNPDYEYDEDTGKRVEG